MELLYNPDRMPEAEIKATFVAREALVDELVELIKSQPDGAGVQHAVIIAPRGMGKTTVLLMVKFAIKDRGLADQWQAVKFPEESYGIYDLSDFWLETLYLIAADTADTELRKLADELKTKYRNNDDLQEAAYAALKDWRRRDGKRLLLLVENFDLILEQINDERDNARLRDVLMNDGTVMLLGGATTFFKEARAYDQPLYNFFKIYNLADLKFVQMEDLLRRRAELDRIADFENRLKENASRLRTLEYFTGGNPRLVLMLYHVVSHSDMAEVRRALEKLLDEVTPYYKAKVEALPPQLRKILDHIARVSGETNEGLTPKEIAEAVRLSQNQVSSQLKRLSELGYVRSANLRGRSSWYTLAEPLYAIWHQMRFGRNARERMRWLVLFLRLWYGVEGMETESRRLDRKFRYHIKANHSQKAHDVLEHHHYLMEAMVNTPVRLQAMERIIRGHLALKDIATVKVELLANINLIDLSDRLLDQLFEVGCLSREQAMNAKTARIKPVPASLDEEFEQVMEAALVAVQKEQYVEVLRHAERLQEVRPDSIIHLVLRAGALIGQGNIDEGLASIDRGLEVEPSSGPLWLLRGRALDEFNRPEEAIASYAMASKLDPERDVAWFLQGKALFELDRYEEAVDCFDKGLKNKPDDVVAWVLSGAALSSLGHFEKAVTSFDKALVLDPNLDLDHGKVVESLRGKALVNTGRYQDAMLSCDRVLEINPGDEDAWFCRGIALHGQGQYGEALACYDRTLAINPVYTEALFKRGVALVELGRREAALADYDRALEINPIDAYGWLIRAYILDELGRYAEAVACYDKALEFKPNDDAIWYNRGNVLDNVGRYEEAVASYDRALEIKPDDSDAWFNRGRTCLNWFIELVQEEELDAAKQKWVEALESGNNANNEDWPDELSEALLEVSQTGKFQFARNLIAESSLEDRLFPLARALDYLQTGDEALIEKLSPEVRGIVEEVVAKLKNVAPPTQAAASPAAGSAK